MTEKEQARYYQYSQNIMDSVADGVFTVDMELRVTSINQAAADLAGITREEALGKPCRDVFHSDICNERCPIHAVMREGKPVVDWEANIVSRNGDRTPIFASATVLRDWYGKIIGVVETIRSRKNLCTILDSVADGVFTVDDNMLIQTFNHAAEEITGFSYEDAIGKPCHEIFRTDACDSACPVREAIQTGESVVNREVEITDRNGHKKPISVSASVLMDSRGKARGGVETIRDLSALTTLKNELNDKFAFKNLVSRNPSMRRLFNVLEDIAGSDATVYLHGESGTGKELFAKAIHELSPRRGGPLVTVNCGALPETLLEAEIFGVRKGAYTGAVENRPGRLELCKGGTFFLDEIGDLPLPLQVKLLRVLENKEFQALGAKNPTKADVRFITATHRDLEQMVEEGTFRRDLYFRINIVKLAIPPLRERKEDIPLLLEMALAKFNAAYGRKVQRVAPEVLKVLLSGSYPGNVRELLNLIEQAVILCKDREITLDLLPKGLVQPAVKETVRRKRSSKAPDSSALAELITRHRGDRASAAEELRIDRSTLWRWLKSADLGHL